jgi:glycerol uptake facilitator-like aquaporin
LAGFGRLRKRCSGGRYPGKELLPYIVDQVLGGLLAATVLYVIANGKAGFDLSGGFDANGYGEYSPGGYDLTLIHLISIPVTNTSVKSAVSSGQWSIRLIGGKEDA